MTEIIPAILSGSFEEIQDSLSWLSEVAEYVQIDVADGRFVPNKTWPYVGDKGDFGEIKKEKKGLPFWEKLDFEADLMVRDPGSVVGDWIKAGADRIIIHLDSTTHDLIHDVLREWNHMAEFGIAISSRTDVEELSGFSENISFVQCMGIERIGFQGQDFDAKIIAKIEEIKKRYPNKEVSVDGGVNRENIEDLLDAGVDRLVIGSAIIKSDNPIEEFEYFKSLVG